MRRVALGVLAPLLATAGLACSTSPDPDPAEIPYRPDRREYRAFHAAFPEILDPNYLPFMVHRLPDAGGAGDVLVFCRWSSDAMPLPVHIAAPEIPESLQNEFDPREPAVYVRAVERALATWVEGLEGLVQFQRVDSAEQARLELILLGELAPEPEPDLKVLGTAAVGDACRPSGWDPDAERLRVRFAVPEVRIFTADQYGLLHPDQVEWIALHEIGHALGMRGHSPIPADLMYEVVRDRVIVKELSAQDLNSFLSLYRLPNGTVYGHVRESPDVVLPAGPPSGSPQLALAPYVNPRLGFSIRPPLGWTRSETSMGMAAVDGVNWDYESSFQVIVQRYPTIEDYLERYGPAYLSHGPMEHVAFIVVNGRRALRAVIAAPDGSFVEELTFIETGDGRVLVVIGDAPAEVFDAYRPWFHAALASLEIWPESAGRRSR